MMEWRFLLILGAGNEKRGASFGMSSGWLVGSNFGEVLGSLCFFMPDEQN